MELSKKALCFFPIFTSLYLFQSVFLFQVLLRILYSMLPQFSSNFIADHVQPLPDLWGILNGALKLLISTLFFSRALIAYFQDPFGYPLLWCFL